MKSNTMTNVEGKICDAQIHRSDPTADYPQDVEGYFGDEPADISQEEIDEMLRTDRERETAQQSQKDSGEQNGRCNYTTDAKEQQSEGCPAPPKRFDCDSGGFGISTPDKLEEIYLFMIKMDLDSARSQFNRRRFERLSDKDLRGLAYETWIHFGCGFIPDWILTKSRAEWQCGTYVNKETGERKHLPPPSNRIIIPTPGMRHFNAIALASDRPRMKKEFWKQHAGEKELFYEKGGVSKAEIVIISEGEVDTMSIWQACIGRRTDRNFAPVAILGCSNWKKTLLPNLSTLLKGKKLLLLLDADTSGKTDSDKLRKALIQRGVPAVSKYLYNALDDYDKGFFGTKVDANELLIERGGDFLNELIETILADATTDFEKAQQEIDSQNLFAPANTPANDASDNPAPKKKYASNPKADVATIKRILKDTVHASSLTRDQWRDVGMIMKYYGFSLEDFKQWSNDGDTRYSADRCQTEWNSFGTFEELAKKDNVVKIGTLIELAKQFGYKPSHNSHQLSDITTKVKIADCPVDLILPRDVLFSDEGITLKETRGEDKTRYITAATTPIVPTKILRNESSGLVQYELAILTQGKWRRHVVDGRTIQSPRRIDELANFGALIKPSSLCEYFTKIIAANGDRLKTWRVFAQPGWYDEKFQHFIYPSGGETYLVDRAGYNYKADYAKRGDADKWKELFSVAMKAGGRIARIACGIAVAAPLIRPLKITNMQAHIFGGVNAGKTVLARLIASIWGNPQELLRTFESSPKRRQADAAANNDMPTIYDELETVRGQRAEASLVQSVYAFFNGRGNQNMNVDGTARDTFKFTGSRLSTGERQILKVADQFGAYKRLVPLECKGKIFDKQLATLIYRFTAGNFGHFGREWTTYIVEHLNAIRERYEEKEKKILDDKYEETQLRTIVAASVAYQFFAQFLKLQNGFDERTFLDDVVATIEELPTVEESSDSARAIEVLRDVVASNEDRFYRETNNANAPRLHEFDPKATGEHWGKLYLDGAVAIYPTTLSNILAKAGFASPEMLIRSWKDEGKLVANDGLNTRRVRIGDARQYTIYFKAGTLSKGRDGYAEPPPES